MTMNFGNHKQVMIDLCPFSQDKVVLNGVQIRFFSEIRGPTEAKFHIGHALE